MQIINTRKTLTIFIVMSIITILLSFPAVAHAQSNDAQMLAELLSHPESEVDISYLDWDANRAKDALNEFISGSLHYSRMELSDINSCTLWSEGDRATKIVINRFTTADTLDILHNKLDARIEGISKLASHISNEEQRAWILLRILAETTTYDKDVPVSHSPYGALLYQRADCAGISTAYKLLCDASNIDCDVVSGIVYNTDNLGYSHAWNVIYIDGEERYVDVTFSLTNIGQANTNWFLLSKDLMWWKKHYLDNEIPFG